MVFDRMKVLALAALLALGLIGVGLHRWASAAGGRDGDRAATAPSGPRASEKKAEDDARAEKDNPKADGPAPTRPAAGGKRSSARRPAPSSRRSRWPGTAPAG